MSKSNCGENLNLKQSLLSDNTKGQNSLRMNLTEKVQGTNKNSFFDEEGRKVFILSISFMLLFTAFGSAQSMVTSLYAQLKFTNLGRILLFIVYIAFGFSSFFLPKLVQQFSHRQVLFVGSISYNLFVIFGYYISDCNTEGVRESFKCQSYFVYPVGIIISLSTGISAIIWICQGDYIDIATSKCPEKKPQYIALFWGIMYSYNIVGSLISFFTLKRGVGIYFATISVIGICSSLIILFFLPNPEPEGYNEILSENNQTKKKPKTSVKETINLLKVREVQLLIPYIWLIGTCLAYFNAATGAQVNQAYMAQQEDKAAPKDQPLINQMTSLVFMLLGVSSFIAGQSAKYLTQRFKLYRLAQFGVISGQAILLCCIVSFVQPSFYMCIINGILWGFFNCFNTTICQAICIQDYSGIIEIQSVFRTGQAVSAALSFFAQMILTEFQFLIFVFTIQIITVLAIQFLQAPSLEEFLKFYPNKLETMLRQSILPSTIQLELKDLNKGLQRTSQDIKYFIEKQQS